MSISDDLRRRAESIAEGQAHGEGLVFLVAVREGEADWLVAEGEAQVFEPEHGLDVQAETGAVIDGVETVPVVYLSGNVVVVIAHQAQAGSHIQAGGPAGIEPLGEAQGEGEGHVREVGFGPGIFHGFDDGPGGNTAENIALLRIAEIYLQVQDTQGNHAVGIDVILPFKEAEIQAQAAVGQVFGNTAHVVVHNADVAAEIPGGIPGGTAHSVRLGQRRKACTGQKGQSKEFFHHFCF